MEQNQESKFLFEFLILVWNFMREGFEFISLFIQLLRQLGFTKIQFRKIKQNTNEIIKMTTMAINKNHSTPYAHKSESSLFPSPI